MASNPVSYSTSPLASQTLSTESVSHAAPWDVFLSFRGPDTRYNFTNHLYNVLDLHGLRTFRDKPELRTGDVIRDELIQAINNSKTYVVVFSEDYATSTWCLDELLEIYKCYKTMNKLVIGVYYHVNPSDVRHQNESFKKSFEKHETGRYAAKMDKVKEWRDALKFVAGFSGQTISSQSDEVDIINEIVEVIQLQINPKTLYVADHPVGLDSRVKHISAWLSRDTEQDMIKIGIYGMGGVGKSTLSKALYNQLLKRKFEASCFLEEVRKKANDIVVLQQQLINDVTKSRNKKVEVYSVAQGKKCIQENLRRKVLVVMDDVDNIEQYTSLVGPFAPGSVVIITTRDENILDQIQVERRFEVDKLDNADSEALFTKHATEKFRSDKILMELSKDILSHADGLPLALKIFGSHLSTESERGWRAYINTLSKNPNSTIEEKLSISLEAIKLVDPMLEEIFLDIACSFIGRKKEEVVDIMDTHYSDVEHNIDILKKRCLLTISITHELRMHDLLRDIGEKLARNNHPTDPGKHTRLWKSSDICDVLRKGMGTEAIECVIPRNFHYHDALEGVSFDTKTYKNMSKLRFLYLKSVNLSGSFGQIFEDIKWLRWDCCPWKYLPSDFCLEKVVVLVLRCSQINTMWEPNKLGFQMLTSLDMSYSLHLTMTPDFTKLPCLETLNLQGCESLTGVHISVGSLKSLAFLDLEYCTMLRRLPDSFCNLRALKTLNIGNCSSLEAVPTDLGKIVSLTELHARKLTVSNVPDSIGHLSNLVKLILSYNKKLQTLPDTICNLSALKVLDIGGCSSLEALPLELGNIESLTELNAWGLNVSEFPDSIKHLSKFVQLNLSQNQYHETSHHTKWEVFISFSGVDTRNKFTDQLYNALLSGGIRTYMDDSELSRKELMGSDGLFPAIQKSEAHILVFSKTYASSPLCLDKVVEILNSQKSMGRLVIPVFYNIEKSVVQHQTESFREAFELHQLRFGMEIVNNWRRKLTEVANFPGYHISESSEENDVIRKIVDELLFLSRKTLHVSDEYPVGLYSRVKEITTLLRSNTKGGVIKLGIYGMGGVGKTTLAKALYNQLLFDGSFQGRSFLAEAGQVLGTERGLVHLQEQLINDVIGENGQAIEVHNVEEGYKLIRDRICSNKILVVLDNLNHIDQISEYLVGPFASGSVVIITTRDQGLLDKMQVEDRYQYRV